MMKTSVKAAAAFSAGFLLGKTQAYSSYNGLALTPAMGWDNWNAYACDVSEDLLLQTAQKMADTGLRDLGYNYVVLDDCWSEGRTENGTLRVDTKKFPNGMKHVSDRIHAMNMKFGMYSSAGTYTCGWYAGSLGYEQADAKFFADNGVDYLKYDNCYNQGQSGTAKLSFDRYNAMSTALNQTGRPIHYAMCNWGEDGPWNWAQTMANQWRMSGDITDSFNRPDERCPCENAYDCLLPGFHCSAMNILNKLANIPSKTQQGAYNDLDMLEVGNGGMSDSEYMVHMSMWALVSSPLIMGTDVTKMTPQSYSIYANPAVLAINQDPTASSGIRVWKFAVPDKDEYGQGDIQLWTRKMQNGDYVMALLNTGTQDRLMNATAADIFTGGSGMEASQTWDMYDLWGNRMDNGTAAAVMNGTYSGSGSGNSTATNGTAPTTDVYTYNATETSYADGLMANHTALFGKKMDTTLAPMSSVTAMVPSHSLKLYRLRSQGPAPMRRRDEL